MAKKKNEKKLKYCLYYIKCDNKVAAKIIEKMFKDAGFVIKEIK